MKARILVSLVGYLIILSVILLIATLIYSGYQGGISYNFVGIFGIVTYIISCIIMTIAGLFLINIGKEL